MHTLEHYLDEYAQSHQNPKNILIHKICVPTIMFSVLGIFKAMPVPAEWPLWLDWSWIIILGALLFYVSLKKWKIFMAMVLMILPQVLLLEWLRPRFFLLSLLLFVLAWVGQFVGHFIEGARPSFFKDLLFLLIGPIWVVKFFTDQMGIDLLNNAKDTSKNL